jgi:cell division transport system ATP-binding protein
LLELKEVTKIYEKNRAAVEGISLQVGKGEFVILAGSNQAGKTTLLKLISLEEFPTSGEIVFDRFSSLTIAKRKIPLLRRKMGRIFPDFRLIDEMNVFDNIALSLRIDGENERRAKRRVSQVMEWLELFRIDRCFPRQLSDGEKQRVACARAMVKEPMLLLADEPTLNLDRENSEVTWRLLRQINILGTAVLLTTCDSFPSSGNHARIIQLDKGKLVPPTTDGSRIPAPV